MPFVLVFPFQWITIAVVVSQETGHFMAIATISADHLQIPQAVEEHICIQCSTEKKPGRLPEVMPGGISSSSLSGLWGFVCMNYKTLYGFMISSKRVSSLSQMDSIMVSLRQTKVIFHPPFSKCWEGA